MSRQVDRAAQNESGTVPKHDPAILLPMNARGRRLRATGCTCIAPCVAASGKLRMFNVWNSDQTLVVDRGWNHCGLHKNPIEIHGTAATTKSPINSAKR